MFDLARDFLAVYSALAADKHSDGGERRQEFDFIIYRKYITLDKLFSFCSHYCHF